MSNYNMNPAVKTKWVAGLRNGEYNHGVGQLRINYPDKVCHCALGILMDIYVKEKGCDWDELYAKVPDNNLLPEEVREWAELDTYTHIKIAGNSTCVSDHSDMRVRFIDIADAIEQQL